VCPAGVVVQGDPDRLNECFEELISNAMHWMTKDRKEIDVQVSLPEKNALPDEIDSTHSYALIHFKDNGAGIPVKNKNKIFDAFFTTRVQGAGLGLALVRRIIEGLGGAIFENGKPGEGADFGIYLPMPAKKRKLRALPRGNNASKKAKE
jgi:signal transduction histidine kinase